METNKIIDLISTFNVDADFNKEDSKAKLFDSLKALFSIDTPEVKTILKSVISYISSKRVEAVEPSEGGEGTQPANTTTTTNESVVYNFETNQLEMADYYLRG